jgi:hypothetical protein
LIEGKDEKFFKDYGYFEDYTNRINRAIKLFENKPKRPIE